MSYETLMFRLAEFHQTDKIKPSEEYRKHSLKEAEKIFGLAERFMTHGRLSDIEIGVLENAMENQIIRLCDIGERGFAFGYTGIYQGLMKKAEESRQMILSA